MVTWMVASAIVIALYILIYYNILKGVPCRSDTSLKGKTAIVTGANTGLGKATALDLARRGARVILACRSKERAEPAVFDIRKKSGNNQVIFMHLDLASLKSVRAFAETFLQSEPQLHLLINNAGTGSIGLTADGFNMAWGVNHLGHFLLTNLLLNRLKQCTPSRIIIISSLTYCMGKIDFSNLNTPGEGFVSGLRNYSFSKLCSTLFARELANRLEGTNVTSYAVHPGFVFTEAFRELGLLIKLVFVPIGFLFFRTPTDGAQTAIYCAVQEGIEKFSGRYFADCEVQKVFPHARDDAVARKVWEISERMAGLCSH
ncbi:dehydrogenase/reductase SDR family member 13-like isoform X1 [Pristis pectinata]|uniref:dehydrogenase/reductase SDR family member 13-like isoform X1 n=1 Tax=Pristis pectinata TaxID=685728 RepID=UPI00223DDA57|nr:dehydrogenase/reductase SDR family member 13-like isoform X1 [Pristis pectinata]XP_051891499.1 dehydrogenase/reductase SDR family member 13-like isoform X1 [Pristis pectinata]XP_051891501.1 dehydrogenase/reductase SDR family member 13-like isoform X1 [Pristis pectinata]